VRSKIWPPAPPSKITVAGGEPVSPMSIEYFASGHHSWIRSVNVANACSTEQSTVTERLIASVSVACLLMPSSSRPRPPP